MADGAVQLPGQLQVAAEAWAARQGLAPEAFVAAAVREKIAAAEAELADERFPLIALRHGAGGIATPVLAGTGIRVQTVVAANTVWEMDVEAIAADYDLAREQVEQALTYYDAHRAVIEADMGEEARVGVEESP